MEKLINISEGIENFFDKYKEKYVNLREFQYDANEDTLTYNGQTIKNASSAIQHTSPNIYELVPDSIFIYLKNGFYHDRTNEIAKIKSMVESEIIITEDEYNILNSFVKQYFARLKIYMDNTTLFNMERTYVLNTFLKDFSIENKIIDNIKKHNYPENTAVQIIESEYQKHMNNINNNQENTLEKAPTLTRNKPGNFNYEFKEQSEIDAMYEQKQKLGVSGFTSIVLIIISTLTVRMFLAINIIN